MKLYFETPFKTSLRNGKQIIKNVIVSDNFNISLDCVSCATCSPIAVLQPVRGLPRVRKGRVPPGDTMIEVIDCLWLPSLLDLISTNHKTVLCNVFPVLWRTKKQANAMLIWVPFWQYGIFGKSVAPRQRNLFFRDWAEKETGHYFAMKIPSCLKHIQSTKSATITKYRFTHSCP